MREAVQKLVDDHIAVAAQYEAVGDADAAARLRAVANMVASLLHGKDAGTLLPPLTDENRAAIKGKAQEFIRAEEKFNERGEKYDDWELQLAYEEGARRTIDMIQRKPQAADRAAFLQGIQDAVQFMDKEPA